VAEEPTAGGIGALLLRHVELLTTLLLALAAVATAWATFQASHWRSEQGLAGNRSTAARVEANRAAGVANRQVQVDVVTFTQWVDAYASGDRRLADFYFRRFREEFRPAVRAWLATRPLENPGAPLTPFELPEYRLAAVAEADRLEEKAADESRAAESHVRRADVYTLCVVMFATSLFFAGISTRMRTEQTRAAILGMGWLLFLGTAAWMATFPAAVRV
jgi:hypothetical protein